MKSLLVYELTQQTINFLHEVWRGNLLFQSRIGTQGGSGRDTGEKWSAQHGLVGLIEDSLQICMFL